MTRKEQKLRGGILRQAISIDVDAIALLRGAAATTGRPACVIAEDAIRREVERLGADRGAIIEPVEPAERDYGVGSKRDRARAYRAISKQRALRAAMKAIEKEEGG